MDTNEGGIAVDDLTVALTRPTGKWGVTWVACILNALIAMEVFMFTKNLLWLLMMIPTHCVLYLACLHDPRIFNLALLWGQTKGRNLTRNFFWHWHCSTYSPLAMHKPPSFLNRRKYRRLING